MAIRPRTDDDIDACVALAQIVHDRDGYPVYLPTDLRGFVASSDADAAWVAQHDGKVVGHVALHKSSSDAVLTLATRMLGVPVQRIGVIARLFVSPDSRRMGLGHALLDIAAREAVAKGRRPILDVVVTHHAAIAPYEACGWRPIGAVTAVLGDGTELDEIVFVGPGNS